MKVGITYNSDIEFNENGRGFTAFILQELFCRLGLEVIFIYHGRDNNSLWWKNMSEIGVSKINIMDVSPIALDILIDIDGVIHPDIRKKIAKRNIMFLRTFLQFSELDKSIYIDSKTPRSCQNVDEVWVWDILNPEETLPSIQTLFPCAIRRVPFIWSPRHILLNNSYNESNINYNNTYYNTKKTWDIYICEKNIDNTSSCILPLVSLPEIIHRDIIDINKIHLYASDDIIKNKYFTYNIHDNIQLNTMNVVNYSTPINISNIDAHNSIILSHNRFTPLQIELLDSIWQGIPLVHNSCEISNIHELLSHMYYNSNSISGICNTIKWISVNYNILYNSKEEIHKGFKKWSIENNMDTWNNIIHTYKNNNRINIDNNMSNNNTIKEIIIGFCDMWPGFNYSNNFFTQILTNNLVNNNYIIKGIEYINGITNIDVNVVIFGPFSNNWKKIPIHIPKIFFSAENCGIKHDNNIALQLVPYSNIKQENIVYLPTWMTFIDWFSNTDALPTNVNDNPILMPLPLLTKPHNKGFSDRSEFCAFVVSNPICTIRNQTFIAFNKYKHINSGGALFNNIGKPLTCKYAGGGCGDITKHKFLTYHKFQLCFENSQAPGYITEKLIHSKMAGCIPIYWGDKDARKYFTDGSFINVSHLNSAEEILEYVQAIEGNTGVCDELASTPLLSGEKIEESRNILKDIANKILSVCLGNIANTGININNNKTKDNKLYGIDKICVINLDRRPDRWQQWCDNNKDIVQYTTRYSAVDGRVLKLNDTIHWLFEHNKFGWKKSVIGCAMSHIKIWKDLIKDSSADKFLICEDDMIFSDLSWKDNWNEIIKYIPNDADVLYLGGVLPTNLHALPSVLQEVNKWWSIIKPNTYFSPSSPRPIFHFCAYSYILTKAGANKLMNWLEHSDQKCFVEIDHLIGHPIVGLNKYVINTFITSCFQEKDIQYIKSDFNSSDIKLYDSDICNNNERFYVDNNNSDEDSDEDTKIIDIYTNTNITSTSLYEYKWLSYLFDKINIKQFDITDISNIKPNSWYLVSRPHVKDYNVFFKYLDSKNIPFNVLHLSDEGIIDNISFYKLSSCKHVVRNYIRNDCLDNDKILNIPLGYHNSINNNNQSITFMDRELIWSFHGTEWFNRKDICNTLSQFVPYNCHFTPEWNHSTMTPDIKYIYYLRNSKFCPVIRGNNPETFRLYECLENGVIPIYVRSEGDKEFWSWISEKICLLNIPDWDRAIELIRFFIKNPEKAEIYRTGLIQKWNNLKLFYKGQIKNLIV